MSTHEDQQQDAPPESPRAEEPFAAPTVITSAASAQDPFYTYHEESDPFARLDAGPRVQASDALSEQMSPVSPSAPPAFAPVGRRLPFKRLAMMVALALLGLVGLGVAFAQTPLLPSAGRVPTSQRSSTHEAIPTLQSTMARPSVQPDRAKAVPSVTPAPGRPPIMTEKANPGAASPGLLSLTLPAGWPSTLARIDAEQAQTVALLFTASEMGDDYRHLASLTAATGYLTRAAQARFATADRRAASAFRQMIIEQRRVRSARPCLQIITRA